MTNPRQIALFGNVNTEEILAKKIRRDGDEPDGYLCSSNDAFRAACRKALLMDDAFIKKTAHLQLNERQYDVCRPIIASYTLSDLLRSRRSLMLARRSPSSPTNSTRRRSMRCSRKRRA